MLICKPAIIENMISSLLQYSTYVASFIYHLIRLLLFICLSLSTKNVFLKEMQAASLESDYASSKIHEYKKNEDDRSLRCFSHLLYVYKQEENKPPVRIELTTPGLQDQCSNH